MIGFNLYLNNKTKMSKKQIFYLIVAAAIYATLVSVMDWHCNEPTKELNYKQINDSLINELKAKNKYIGIVETELSKANEKRVKVENELNERKVVYLTRIEKIYQTAPDTCQPYLAAMKAECDTLQAKSDSTISALKNEVAAIDTVKEAYKSKSETLAHLNDVLTDENKELINDNKKLERKAKFTRIVNKIVVGVAAVATAVCVYVTTFKG